MVRLNSTELEKPTITERVVNVFPGPYLVKCLLFWAIFGTPGMVLTRYLDTFSVDKALAIFDQVAPLNIAIFSMANFVMPLYGFYGIRKMRLKIVETLPKIEPLAVRGSKSVRDFFALVRKPMPAIALTVGFGALSILSFPGQVQHVAGILSAIIKVIGFVFASLSYGTFIWIYVSSIVGIYRLSNEPLNFVSFLEDRYLGMKPFGFISLTFAWVYFLGLGLVFFSSNPLPIYLLATLLGLVLLGIVIFLLPLWTIHVKMIVGKQAAEEAHRKQVSQVIKALNSKKGDGKVIAKVLISQMIEQKVSKISEWPFDTVTLGWFSAIVITVLGSIITRYVIAFVGL